MLRPKRYEVAIYNEHVKKSVREGDPNKTGLSDDWADVHYLEVRAASPDVARSKILGQYPESRGFVVLEVRDMEPDPS
jgi:hypothetical protein